ncbi:hypothetical protein Taro_009828 [Colocasia esculenta]|uniref:Uncharacterized protein n=1 Tax=Colocasia esculenta TaxID=4460 RepID=A0A843U5Y3_COLES|nr:hypothetical protein [Colocasia esculenta]
MSIVFLKFSSASSKGPFQLSLQISLILQVSSSLTSWRVRGVGWFCLWALILVEVRGGRAFGETVLLTWLLSVSHDSGLTWLLRCSVSSFVSMGVCRGVASACVDSAGSVGVMFGLTRFASTFVGVPAALTGKGLVIPTEPCSRGSLPYSLQVGTPCGRSSLPDGCGGGLFAVHCQ